MSEHLTAAEAAKLLGCSETLIRNRLTAGTLPGAKVLGRWHILREDVAAQAKPHASSQPNRTTPPTNQTAEPHNQTEQAHHPTTKPHNETERHNAQWRDDLLGQVARLEEDKVAGAEREAALREDLGLRIEASKARVIDLERELTVRDSRIADLAEQNQVLEAKVRSTLEERAEENGQLANRIADLVAAHTEMQTRVVELQPVADRVPMLQAAVEEKEANLSERECELGNMKADIDAIASRPVTGPVFRLLTRGGRLRR